jgi:hypothetical protein
VVRRLFSSSPLLLLVLHHPHRPSIVIAGSESETLKSGRFRGVPSDQQLDRASLVRSGGHRRLQNSAVTVGSDGATVVRERPLLPQAEIEPAMVGDPPRGDLASGGAGIKCFLHTEGRDAITLAAEPIRRRD